MVVDAAPEEASRRPVQMHAARGSDRLVPLGGVVRSPVKATKLVPRVRVAVVSDAPLGQLLLAVVLAQGRRCFGGR